MTTEERFERIEHVTAGLAEERRKDREEFRALWRDTQLQLNELTLKVAAVADKLDRVGTRITELPPVTAKPPSATAKPTAASVRRTRGSINS